MWGVTFGGRKADVRSTRVALGNRIWHARQLAKTFSVPFRRFAVAPRTHAVNPARTGRRITKRVVVEQAASRPRGLGSASVSSFCSRSGRSGPSRCRGTGSYHGTCRSRQALGNLALGLNSRPSSVDIRRRRPPKRRSVHSTCSARPARPGSATIPASEKSGAPTIAPLHPQQNCRIALYTRLARCTATAVAHQQLHHHAPRTLHHAPRWRRTASRVPHPLPRTAWALHVVVAVVHVR